MLIKEHKFYKLLIYVILLIFLIISAIYLFTVNSMRKDELIEVKEPNLVFSPLLPQLLKPLDNNYKNRLFNITLNYKTLPGSCNDDDLLAILIVTSYFGNIETRSAMRRSYSHDDLLKYRMKRIFLLGEAPHDQYTTQESIINENRRFNDILQGNFIENYRNLTYKHIMGLKWSSENCNNVQYIIKMDDDIVVDMIKIISLLQTTNFPKNLIAGKILKRMPVIRTIANKWYVNESEYNHPLYPTFVSGWFYITTPRIATKFVLLSNYIDYFWIDDVYVTGILANYLKIKHYSLDLYFTPHTEYLQCCMNDVIKKNYDCDFLIGPNGGDNNMFYDFNKIMKLCQINRCVKRIKPINQTCVAEKRIHIGHGRGFIENYRLS